MTAEAICMTMSRVLSLFHFFIPRWKSVNFSRMIPVSHWIAYVQRLTESVAAVYLS